MAAHPANSRARTDKWKGVDTSVKKCHVGIRYKQEEGDLAAQVRCESSVKFAGSIQKTTYSRHNLAQSRDSSFPMATSAPSGHDAPTVPTYPPFIIHHFLPHLSPSKYGVSPYYPSRTYSRQHFKQFHPTNQRWYSIHSRILLVLEDLDPMKINKTTTKIAEENSLHLLSLPHFL